MAPVARTGRTGRGAVTQVLEDGAEVPVGPSFNANVIAALKATL